MATLTESQFLNVDLDVRSKHDLAPVIDALGKKVIVLHARNEAGRDLVVLELSRGSSDADRCLRRFVRLVERLPADARECWDAATSRTFNIGIRAASPNGGQYAATIATSTLRGVVDVGGEIAFTIYPPEA